MAGAVGKVSSGGQAQPWEGEGPDKKRDTEKVVERRKDGEEKGEGKERISGVHIPFLAPGAAACFQGSGLCSISNLACLRA